MDLSFESNIRAFERDLSNLAASQLPFAVALALNEVGAEAIEANKAEMARAFDRPTRWTLNAFHFRRASKSKPAITIERKLPARGRHYLETQATGGPRPHTGLEKQLAQRLSYAGQIGFIVPTSAMKLDAHGNIPRGMMQRILSRIGAQGDGANNSTEASRARTPGFHYFVPRPGSRLSPGIYQRDKAGGITKLIAFEAKQPTYRPRFNFEAAMLTTARRAFPAALGRALARALATAR